MPISHVIFFVSKWGGVQMLRSAAWISVVKGVLAAAFYSSFWNTGLGWPVGPVQYFIVSMDFREVNYCAVHRGVSFTYPSDLGKRVTSIPTSACVLHAGVREQLPIWRFSEISQYKIQTQSQRSLCAMIWRLTFQQICFRPILLNSGRMRKSQTYDR